MDILLDRNGDLFLDSMGDIVLNDSVSQQIKIRLRWFASEWRWDEEMGLPYFEELMVKNPNIEYFEGLIREEIFNVDKVTDVESVNIAYDSKTRKGTIRFVAYTDSETIKEEVVLYG